MYLYTHSTNYHKNDIFFYVTITDPGHQDY